MDLNLTLGILNLICDIILILPVIYLIWDHFKDDRLLTKQVQEFYYSIERLIYFYNYEGLFTAYFCDNFWKENRSRIFIRDKVFFEGIRKKFIHKLNYIKEKIMQDFQNNAKYLGFILIGKEDEIFSNYKYFNDTNIILTHEGKLNYYNDEPLTNNFINMKQVPDGWKILNYLKSLRSYWYKNYKKRLIRPKLKIRYNTRKKIFSFDEDVRIRLNDIKKHQKHLQSCKYCKLYVIHEHIKVLNNLLQEIDNELQ